MDIDALINYLSDVAIELQEKCNSMSDKDRFQRGCAYCDNEDIDTEIDFSDFNDFNDFNDNDY